MTTPTQAQIEVEELVNHQPLTPTQAQIEAAAKALYGDHGRPPSDKAMGMAKAALVAAAEVGEPSLAGSIRAENERIVRVKAATIERCAQVCDKAANDPRATKEYRYFCINMAAAIRNLRD